MNELTKALLAGLSFGLSAVILMMPLNFGGKAKKREAIIAAFIERFSIGFVIPFISLPVPHSLTGLLLGVLLSLPSAIITKTYVPLLVIGAVGGGIIGFLS